MTWISPPENKNKNSSFNTYLRDAKDWRPFFFLTGFREQFMLVEGSVPRRKSNVAFVYVQTDETVRFFRIGVKLQLDLQDLDFDETNPYQFLWRAKAKVVMNTKFYSYEVQRNNTSNGYVKRVMPNIEGLQRDALLRLSRMPLEIDYRRLDNRVQVPIVGSMASNDLGDRILDLGT